VRSSERPSRSNVARQLRTVSVEISVSSIWPQVQSDVTPPQAVVLFVGPLPYPVFLDPSLAILAERNATGKWVRPVAPQYLRIDYREPLLSVRLLPNVSGAERMSPSGPR
jgi:hypothetical protein